MIEELGEDAMKTSRVFLLGLAALVLISVSCYRRYGFHLYPETPRFSPSDPQRVALLRNEPRREHVRLGEVWIRPEPWDDRYYVENVLRENAAAMGADALVIVADRYFRERTVFSYWRGPRAVYERQIVGIAIRYRR
jgi:hypothetical protein